MDNGINRFFEECGAYIVSASKSGSRAEATASNVGNLVLNGKPLWSRHALFLLENKVNDETVWHEANHLSRGIVQCCLAPWKGKLRVKPPRGFRGMRRDLWQEELECYLQGTIAALVLKWWSLGFPNVQDDAHADSLGLPEPPVLGIYDPFREQYLT